MAGAMLAVPLDEEELLPLLDAEGGARLDLAAVNAPRRCVVSGSPQAVAELVARLAARGIQGAPLPASRAFHSAMMEPVLEPFARQVAGVRLNPPEIPFLSNVTGTWAAAEEVTRPE